MSALALAAMLAYALAALPAAALARGSAVALVLGWVLHALVLMADISGFGQAGAGVRWGFGSVLSLTVWLMVAGHTVESRLLPLPAWRRVLSVAGAAAVWLAWMFPGETRPLPGSPLAPLHWVLGVASYGLFGAAVLHGVLLDAAERRLRLRSPAASGTLGMPLLRLERLTFRFVEMGFAALSAAVLLGVLTTVQWRWDHKVVLSLLAWLVFASLLVGRQWRGWRGRRATRWLYVGAALLLLAYAGSRFVFEVVLGRSAG